LASGEEVAAGEGGEDGFEIRDERHAKPIVSWNSVVLPSGVAGVIMFVAEALQNIADAISGYLEVVAELTI
jgi:hypothetical protein